MCDNTYAWAVLFFLDLVGTAACWPNLKDGLQEQNCLDRLMWVRCQSGVLKWEATPHQCTLILLF